MNTSRWFRKFMSSKSIGPTKLDFFPLFSQRKKTVYILQLGPFIPKMDSEDILRC